MPEQSRRIVHDDIKPENTPELASRYLDVPNMPWETLKPNRFAEGQKFFTEEEANRPGA